LLYSCFGLTLLKPAVNISTAEILSVTVRRRFENNSAGLCGLSVRKMILLYMQTGIFKPSLLDLGAQTNEQTDGRTTRLHNTASL